MADSSSASHRHNHHPQYKQLKAYLRTLNILAYNYDNRVDEADNALDKINAISANTELLKVTRAVHAMTTFADRVPSKDHQTIAKAILFKWESVKKSESSSKSGSSSKSESKLSNKSIVIKHKATSLKISSDALNTVALIAKKQKKLEPFVDTMEKKKPVVPSGFEVVLVRVPLTWQQEKMMFECNWREDPSLLDFDPEQMMEVKIPLNKARSVAFKALKDVCAIIDLGDDGFKYNFDPLIKAFELEEAVYNQVRSVGYSARILSVFNVLKEAQHGQVAKNFVMGLLSAKDLAKLNFE